MIIFVDNIHFKNENNFKSLFRYLKDNNIKYIKNTFGDKGLKKAQGDYSFFQDKLPNVSLKKEEIYNDYWELFKDELLYFLLKKEEIYSLDKDITNDKELFDYIYLNYCNELQNNLKATIFWLDYWNKTYNYNNIYICFSNTLIYTKTLSKILKEKQIPLYVMEHFATGTDFYFDKRYTHIPNNAKKIKISEKFDIQKYYQALKRFENWNNKNVKKIKTKKKLFFNNNRDTFLLATQVVNDFSIISTKRKYLSVITYYKKIIDKILNETNSNLIIKTHPFEKIKNGEAITYNVLSDYIYKYHNKNIHRVCILEDYDLDVIIDNIQASIVFNSQIAFELANKGIPIITFGNPFYKDYFTIDEDIDNIHFKEASEYKINDFNFKKYLTSFMDYLYYNEDIKKIENELSQYKLEIKINDFFVNSKKNNTNIHNKKHSNNFTYSFFLNIEEYIIKKLVNEKKYKKYKKNRKLFFEDSNKIFAKIYKKLFLRE